MKFMRNLSLAWAGLLPAALAAQVVITFEAILQENAIPLDSIHVENLNGSGDTTIYYPDHQLVLDFSTGLLGRAVEAAPIRSMPNPFNGSTEIAVESTGGTMRVQVYDAAGRSTAFLSVEAAPGLHRFRYSSGMPGVHFVSAEQNDERHTQRLVSMEGAGRATGTLSHISVEGRSKSNRSLFTWQPGDELRCIGYASNDTAMYSGVILHTPTTSTTRTFTFHAPTCAEAPTVTDADGNVYPVVRIGEQCWMGANLRTAHYSDGTAIPNVTGNNDWRQLNTGAWSYYENNSSYNATSGKLYNWLAATDPRGVCPLGWHVPSDAEWAILESTLGMPASELNEPGVRGEAQNVGGKMKSVSLWNAPNGGATNESGFTAFASGARDGFSEGGFFNSGSYGYWWTSSEHNMFNYAQYRSLSYFNTGVGRYGTYKRSGFCIRCLRD